MFLKVDENWLDSYRLLKLQHLGVSQPLLFILRTWKFALDECKKTAPHIKEEQLAELEKQVKWHGADGDLIKAFRSVGFLDEDNTLSLWWDEGAEPLNEARRRAREKKAKQRKKAKADDEEASPQPEPSVPQSDETVPQSSDGVPPKTTGTRSQSRVEKSREDYSKRTWAGTEGTTNAPSVPLDPAAAPNGDWHAIKHAFLGEYEHRCNGHPPGGGKWGKGFFSANGSFDVAEYLDKTAKHYPRVIRIALPSFWPEWDKKQPKNRKGHYPADMKGELEMYLMSRGLPSPGQRMMAGKI